MSHLRTPMKLIELCKASIMLIKYFQVYYFDKNQINSIAIILEEEPLIYTCITRVGLE